MILGRQIKNCRMCESTSLYEFLDLGFAPPSDEIRTKEELKQPKILFPLIVMQCQDCGLTQLSYAANPTLMYGQNYSYESSITESGKKHFFDMATSICIKLNLQKESFVIDIGSNVGVLLEGFKKNKMETLGIDPAPKICKIANDRGIETIQSLINPKIASQIVSKKGKAKVITGTNVFAHIDDKKGLIESLEILLDNDGVFIIEAPYLIDLINNLEYDTIYLEHLEYTSIKPLVKFFNKNNMNVFDVERTDIHGKSIRVFVCRNSQRQISKNVNFLLNLEESEGIYSTLVLDEFAKKVENHKTQLTTLLQNLKSQGKKIIGISAPAKGNTILNYCNIGTNLIDYMTEKSVIKQGHYTPGMHIPILSEEKSIQDNVDYGIIFAWNFADEIIKNNQEFINKGGKFIIPIPRPFIK
jgi:hypothetical protein